MDEHRDNGKPAETAVTPRRSLLNLAPLELDCMNTLWPLGEGTVREIRDGLASRRARAYTTIMTIMDRLARKGIVERRKSGRAYIYRPQLSAEEARRQAVGAVVEGFFGGSSTAAAEFLSSGATHQAASTIQPARAFAAVAAAGDASPLTRPRPAPKPTLSPDAESPREDGARIDETLL